MKKNPLNKYINMTEFRTRINHWVNYVNDELEQIIITNFGKPMCVLISRLDYSALELHKMMDKKSKGKSPVLDNVVNITELKNKINQWIQFIQKEQHPIIITSKGKPTAALISNKDYAYLKPKIEKSYSKIDEFLHKTPNDVYMTCQFGHTFSIPKSDLGKPNQCPYPHPSEKELREMKMKIEAENNVIIRKRILEAYKKLIMASQIASHGPSWAPIISYFMAPCGLAISYAVKALCLKLGVSDNEDEYHHDDRYELTNLISEVLSTVPEEKKLKLLDYFSQVGSMLQENIGKDKSIFSNSSNQGVFDHYIKALVMSIKEHFMDFEDEEEKENIFIPLFTTHEDYHLTFMDATKHTFVILLNSIGDQVFADLEEDINQVISKNPEAKEHYVEVLQEYKDLSTRYML